MYECESWTIKKTEYWRSDAIRLWCWRRLLRIPWTARRSNQSILKEINPEYYWKDWCWSWSSNTLGTCTNSWLIGKDSDPGKDWRQKKRVIEGEMVGWHYQFNGQELGQTLGDSEGQWGLACHSPWGCKESDTTWRRNTHKYLGAHCSSKAGHAVYALVQQ